MSDDNITDINKFRNRHTPAAGTSFEQASAPAPTPEISDEELVEGPLYKIMLEHMKAQNPNMIQYFRDSMRSLVNEMNRDAALAQQKGSHEGEKLKQGAKAEFSETMFAFWMYIEPPLWEALMESYEDDIWTYHSDKFTKICEAVSPDALDYYLDKGVHEDPAAMRYAFEESLLKEMEPLQLLTGMIAQHIPDVEIIPSVFYGSDFVTPVITLKSKDGLDLRRHLQPFLDQTPAGTKPILKPV
ncbi:MAG: hypothetical protein ACK4NR_01200 [Micavibrio sp.]